VLVDHVDFFCVNGCHVNEAAFDNYWLGWFWPDHIPCIMAVAGGDNAFSYGAVD